MWVIAAINQASKVVAHNYDFEWAIWENIMVKRYDFPEIPIERWECTMARASARGLPKSLEHAALATGITEQKDTVGGRLLQRLCKPTNKGVFDEDPDKYTRLYEYCTQDVETTRALDEILPALTGDERATFELDGEINRRGIGVDRKAVESILEILAKETIRGDEELERITEGKITSHGQAAKIAKFCGIADCTKATVAGELEVGELSPVQRRVLEIRRDLSKSSTKKFPTMLDRCCGDERLRSLLQYHGAKTGRWAGRGPQPQNLPRWPKGINGEEVLRDFLESPDMIDVYYGNIHSAASWTLRSCLTAKEGKTLFCGDFSSIEGRVLAWYAKEQETLSSYAQGLDLYKVAASAIYGIPYDQVNEEQRFIGKVAELALGYQGWVGAFISMAANFGVEITEAKAEDICRAWRDKRKKTVDLWHNTNADAIAASGMFFRDGRDLICELPSGRHMVYPDAETRYITDRYDRKKATLTFMAPKTPSMKKTDILSVHSNSDRYVRVKTYGGCLTENIVQATARDLLVEAMKRAPEYPVVIHVHDEIVAEAHKEKSLEEFIGLFSIVPNWAEGLPIEVKGWKGDRYRK
jgi:DNA polymerase